MANMQRGGPMNAFRGRRDSSEFDRKFLFRFLIPFKAAAIIAGKSGERIQRLRAECNSRLSIPDNKGPERIFIIDGPFETCVRVWTECFPDLKDVMGAKNGDEMDIRFLCHNSIVGAVIGKGGTRVKEMRLTYNLTLIKVHVDQAPKSTDRVIQIVGAPDKIFGCLKVIFAELETQNVRGPIDNYNADNYDEQLAQTYGGWKGEPGWQFANQSSLGGDGGYEQPAGGYGEFGSALDSYGGGMTRAPQMSQFDNARNAPPPMNQYETMRNGPPPPSMNQYDTSMSVPPPMNAYERNQYGSDTSRGGPPQPGAVMNQYGSTRNMDPYEAAPQLNQYGSRGNDPCESSTNYEATRGGGAPMNQYGGNRPPGNSFDPYDAARAAPPAMNQYGGNMGGAGGAPMNQYGSGRVNQYEHNEYDNNETGGQGIHQYGQGPDEFEGGRGGFGGGRNMGAPMNHYDNARGGSLGGGMGRGGTGNQYDSGRGGGAMSRNSGGSGNNYDRGRMGPDGGRPNASTIDAAGRTIVPLMDQCNYQDDFYKPPSRFGGGAATTNSGHQDGGNGRGNQRRTFQEDRSSRPPVGAPPGAKKPRPWSNESDDNNYSMAGSSAIAISADNVDITIPATYLAALKGVDGEKLSNMMRDSGAEIVVLSSPVISDTSKGGEAVINIKGTKDQIEGAQYLMQMCMKRCMLNLTHG